MDKTEIEIVSVRNNSLDFKIGKMTFTVDLIVNSSLSIVIKTKLGKIYEGIFTYEELAKNKMLRIYDDIQEIHQLIQQKLKQKSFNIQFSDDKSEIILESSIEGKNFQLNLILNLTKDFDPKFLMEDLLRTNSYLEEKVLSLEKALEELKIKNRNIEERLEKIENSLVLWDINSVISCWQCGKNNDGTIRKKIYTKTDGRCDKFVSNGYWGVCVKCDPNNSYKN